MRLSSLLCASSIGCALSQNTTGLHCCQSLKDAGLGPAIISPSDATTFEASVDGYFSQLARLSPDCFIQPASAADVSKIVTTLLAANKTQQCQFAIRSGGHISWPGAAGIENGVTIDMSKLKSISYSSADNTFAVGPGARWGEVYEALDKIGIMTTGGRASPVGVGGLTLGGGNSYYAARKGMVCDNAASFEVVLASGTIVTANRTDHADLVQVLKGGNLNFGIVTNIVFKTFPGGPIFGGTVVYPGSTSEQQLEALVNFGNCINGDPYASVIVMPYYDSKTNASTFLNAYEYTKPVQQRLVTEPTSYCWVLV